MHTKYARTAAMSGMLSAILWLVALTVEYAFHLQPPGNDSLLFYLDQLLFFLAMLGYLILLTGLWQVKAAGKGIFGKISLGIFIAGLVGLLVAQVVGTLTRDPNFFLYPIGGMLQLLGGLLTGIAVATARRWTGWQRFAPLLQGLYYLALILSLVILKQPPTQLTESIWQVAWFITSLALFTTLKAGATQTQGGAGNDAALYQAGVTRSNGQ